MASLPVQEQKNLGEILESQWYVTVSVITVLGLNYGCMFVCGFYISGMLFKPNSTQT